MSVTCDFICKPVSGRGIMSAKGYVPENAAYRDILTDTVSGKTIGRNPMDIPLDDLNRAGHPNRRTRDVVSALEDVFVDIRRHKDIRRHCLECVENAAEVRRCAVIDCPAWPYRMGKNPHNPRRGKNPFT